MAVDESLRNRAIYMLEKEQKQLDGAFDKQSDVRAPENFSYSEYSQDEKTGEWSEKKVPPKNKIYDETVIDEKEKDFKEEAEVLQEFCKEIDIRIMGYNSQINVKKQDIVDLSSTAIGGNCWPGIAQSTGGNNNSLTVNHSTVTDINNEEERSKIYKSMAGPGYNTKTENPFEPDVIEFVSTTNAGYGYKNLPENKLFKNNSNVATGLNTDGSGPDIGDGRFDISKTASDHSGPRTITNAPGGLTPPQTWTHQYSGATIGNCVGIANSIDSIYNEIISLRIERDSLRADLNIVKEKKRDKELGHWGYQNMKGEVATRQTSNTNIIRAVKSFGLTTSTAPAGLVLELDAANNSSYFGAGEIWYDLSESNSDAALEPGTAPAGIATFAQGLTEETNFFVFDGVDDHVDFTAGHSNHIEIDANTEVVSVEVLAEMRVDIDYITATNINGYMLFGFDEYSVWTGPVEPHRPFSFGFNTGNSDIYGLTATQMNSLQINKDSGQNEADDVLTGQWAHYVFEMWKGSVKPITDNKIYINGQSQVLSQVRGTADDSERVFNGGVGRICGWRLNNNHRMPVNLQVFKVYNQAFTDQEVREKYESLRRRFSI